MEKTCPNYPGSPSHMHESYPQALDSLALFYPQSMGDMPNYGLGDYLEKHAVAPRIEQ
jgi:hypothetical protein